MTDDFKQIKKLLSKLPTTLQQKIVVRATRKAALLIKKEAKNRVPIRTGLLKKSIGIAKAKKKDTPSDITRFYIIPKSVIRFTKKITVNGQSGKLKAKIYAYHAHFVEFGTKKMTAEPFLLPAAKATKMQVVSTFKEELYGQIEKEIPKIAKEV